MAVVNKNGVPSLASLLPQQGDRPSYMAAEDIEAGDACRITAAGVVRSIGAEDVDGFAAKSASEGESLTLFINQRIYYGSGLTPGASLYLDTVTAGALNTTVGAGANAKPVARVVDTDKIQVLQRFA